MLVFCNRFDTFLAEREGRELWLMEYRVNGVDLWKLHTKQPT